MTDHYLYRGDFDYFAYHRGGEVTGVLNRKTFHGQITEKDRLFLKIGLADSDPVEDVYTIIDVWEDEFAGIIIVASETSVASSH